MATKSAASSPNWFAKQINSFNQLNEETRSLESAQFFSNRIPKIERILEVVSLHYKLRAVSNMFLKNVVSHIQKSSEFDLSSSDEIFQFVDFVAKVAPEFMQLVDNHSGLILRLNHQVTLSEVFRKIRDQLQLNQGTGRLEGTVEVVPPNGKELVESS